MTVSLKPLNDQIWVIPLQPNGKLYEEEFLNVEGGLLTWSRTKGPNRGIVMELGPGKLDEKLNLIPMPKLEIGDVIRWSDGSAIQVINQKQKLYLVSAESIIGIER